MQATLPPPLRPDPHLPHRDRLLQDGFVSEWLSRHLGSNVPVQFDCVERARVKYRIGESLRIVFRLRAGAAESIVAARMFRPGRSGRAFREASRTAAAVGPFRGVSHAPDLDTVFWTFPNDRKIADLALLHSPAPLLARALGVSRLRTRVVAYAPEKSATAACLADSGEVVAYAKVYAEAQGPRVSGIYRDVQRGLPRLAAKLRVPRVLSGADAHGALILEAVEGACLSRVPSRHQEAGFERLGAALASMHALPPPAARFARLSRRRLRQAASLISQVRPDVEGLALDLVQRLVASRSSREPVVRLHGDVHPKNVILADGHVALIDLDQSAAGPAAADLGSFLAHLRSERALGDVSPSHERRLVRAFLGGYGKVRDLPSADSLRWHTAAALLAERALRAVNRIRPDGLARLGDLLACARDLVTGEGDA
jgi:aminoglycoside phosphotransferase